MNNLMTQQITAITKPFTTLVTFERLHLQMCEFNVFFKQRARLEFQRAKFTWERPMISMAEFMLFKI
jgi:hypothetical protein